MKDKQKIGGFAALALGISFLALIVLLLTVAGQGYVPGSGNDPAKALSFAATSPIPYIIYLLYALFAILIVLIVTALADELATGAPARMRLAVTAATVTGGLFIAYAMLGYIGEPTLLRAYQQNVAAGTAAYLAVRVVSNALNTGAIFAAGWAILLAGWAARETARFPKLLAYLLMISGVLSVLAFVVPPFSLIAPLLYIVWSIWLGISLLRRPMLAVARAPAQV